LNDFHIGRLLGSGCNGMVWQAQVKGYPPNIPSVALKMIYNYGILTRQIPTNARFIQEFKILQRLQKTRSHRNIIHLVHHFHDRPTNSLVQDAHPSVQEFLYHDQMRTRPRTTTFYALEWHPDTVQDRLKEGRLDDSRLNQFAKDLFKGLLFLKNNHVIHLDMKLDNLLISRDDRLIIADFGEGIILDDENYLASVGGNSLHHSPELLKFISQHPTMNQENKKEIDFTSQYSWEAGTILYELCCDQFPFEGYPHFNTVISRRTLNLHRIPPRFHEVLVGLLVDNPRMALETASELIHQL